MRSKQSQIARIYEYFKKGKSLTPLQGLAKFGTLNLSTKCSQIQDVYGVELKRVPVKGESYLRYSLG